MGYVAALSRISQITSLLQGVEAAPPAAVPGGAAGTQFAQLLDQAGLVQQTGAVAGGPGSAGERALAAARSQLGVTEQPPGSNDGPQIAAYRNAVAGSYPGAPWCAYFVSWAAAQAGAPIGDGGRGEGSVEGIAAWAARTGRLTNDPRPGDLILFGGRHVGIVESVNGDGSLTTVEGNTTDGVHRRTHARSEATGFVRL
jgi:hypothetical protein